MKRLAGLVLAAALLPDAQPGWQAEAPAPTVVTSASLTAGEDGESTPSQLEQSKASPTPVPDTAPASALAGAWPTVSAAALAAIAWLRGRKH